MKKQTEEQIVNSNGFTESQQLRILIWGDKKLGVRGLKGRTERVEKLVIATMAMNIVSLLAFAAHVGLQFNGQGGLLGAILRGLLGG
jgi:hypothetical protein